MGRWMSPDWADKPEPVPYADLSDPQSLNLYGYVRNNPMSRNDKDGHGGCPVCDYTIEEVDQAIAYLAKGTVVAGSTLLRTTLGVAAIVLTPTSASSPHELQMEEQMRTATGGNRGKDGGNDKKTAASPGPDGMKKGSSKPEGAGKPFNEATKDAARTESGNKCVFCGKETTRTPGPDQSNIDHAQAASQNGDNSLDNAQNTCRTCNLDKGTRSTDEYIDHLKNNPR